MDRLKLETLTDKDVCQEEEEKGGQSVKGLQASQPQPSTNQVLLMEDDLNIEEYSSDWPFWSLKVYRFTLFVLVLFTVNYGLICVWDEVCSKINLKLNVWLVNFLFLF